MLISFRAERTSTPKVGEGLEHRRARRDRAHRGARNLECSSTTGRRSGSASTGGGTRKIRTPSAVRTTMTRPGWRARRLSTSLLVQRIATGEPGPVFHRAPLQLFKRNSALHPFQQTRFLKLDLTPYEICRCTRKVSKL